MIMIRGKIAGPIPVGAAERLTRRIEHVYFYYITILLIRMHLGHFIICAQTVEDWSTQLRDVAIRIAQSESDRDITIQNQRVSVTLLIDRGLSTSNPFASVR
jgi:hypothetical protein